MKGFAALKSRLGFWACVALAAFILGGCATLGGIMGQMYLMSSDEEVAAGLQMSKEVPNQFKIYNNSTVTSYVQTVGARIVNVCGRKDITYHFAVITSEEINAFSLPGGYVYVYTGLMKSVNDESALASVLAHEIAHVVARHAAQRLSSMYAADAIQRAVLGDNPGLFGQIVGGLMTEGGLLAYGRENEYEADDLGQKYVYAARYDPNGMADVMRKLISLESGEPSKLGAMLATHPPTTERLKRIEAAIAAESKLTNPVRNAAEYLRIRAMLP
jgi:predicted Zn-dependent protease